MSYEEVVNRLEELRSQKGFSSSDKSEIEVMYHEIMSKDFVRTSCSDCYRDALIEMYITLKKTGKMKEKSSYTLKNGVLLHEFGSAEMYTNANLTDEVAENYLSRNPKGINLFAGYPQDWKDRVKKRANPGRTLNEGLMFALIDAMQEGKTPDALKEEYKEYQIDGRKISAKLLTAHLKEAQIAFEELKKDE